MTMKALRAIGRCSALLALGTALIAGPGCAALERQAERFDEAQASGEIRFEVLWRARAGRFSNQSFRPSEAGGVAVSEDGRTVLVGTQAGILHAFNAATGEELWQKSLGAWFSSAAAIYDGAAVLALGDGTLRAFRIQDGEELWQLNTGMVLYGKPILHGDRVYVTGSAEAILAVDARTGQELWRHNHQRIADLQIRGGGVPLVTEDSVYVGFSDGSLFRLDHAGRVVWATDLAQGERRLRDVDAQPVLHQGTVYAVSHSGGAQRGQ